MTAPDGDRPAKDSSEAPPARSGPGSSATAFRLESPFEPAGDQPQAIYALVRGFTGGERHQVLLGVTGSGKTLTVANAIRRLGRPALVLSHNKTLAAQLYGELKSFFPSNAVEYFISYYDYYQPEAYVPQTDTYIEKDASITARDRPPPAIAERLITRRLRGRTGTPHQ